MPSGPDVSLVSQRWLEAGCRLDEPSRRAVVSAVLHEVERPGDPTTTWIDQLYAFDPTLSPSTGDVHHLRLVLREVINDRSAPEDAARLQHRAAIIVDDLVGAITQRRLEALEQTARVDALTSLGNRRAGEEALQRAVAHAKRRERPLAVAMIDLDGLKRINDTQGHAAGDEALRLLGISLVSGMRTEDAAYRFGGDEFVVVAPETSSEELRTVLERIRPSSPSFSIGVAALGPGVEDSAALLAAADADLYRGRRGEAAAAAEIERRRGPVGGFDLVVPLFALAVGVAAAVAADGVRRVAGIEISENRWLWLGALAATPAVLVGATLHQAGARSAQLGHVLRSGGVAVLALVAALTPLVSGTIDRRATPRRDDPGTFDPDRTALPPTTTIPRQVDVDVEAGEDVVEPPTTTTTITVVPGVGLVATPATPSAATTDDDVDAVPPRIPGSQVTVTPRPVPGVLIPTAPIVPPAAPIVWPTIPIAWPSPTTPDTEAAGETPKPQPDRGKPQPATLGSGPTSGPPTFAHADERGRGDGPDRARQRLASGLVDPHPGNGHGAGGNGKKR